MVCLGNICRSPTAHGVLQKKLNDKGLDWVKVDSAGTAAYHVGKLPDARAIAAAKARGYDLTSLRARQVNNDDFFKFDYIFAMDHQNLIDLKKRQPDESQAKVVMAMSFSQIGVIEVPDPYYGGGEGFDEVLDICERMSDDIIRKVIQESTL